MHIRKDIFFKLHHTSLHTFRPFCMTAGSAANTAISIFCEWGSMNFNSPHHSYY